MRKGFVLYWLCVLVLLSSLSIVPMSKSPQAPTLEGDVVYIDNRQAFISLSPHTIVESSYVYLNVSSKLFSGQIDILFGFDRSLIHPKSFDLYNPRIVVRSRNLMDIWDNPLYKVNYTYTSFEAPLAYNGTVWVWQNKTFGGLNDEDDYAVSWRWVLKWEQEYDEANINTRTIFWREFELWQNLLDKLDIQKVDHDFRGMNTWFYTNASVDANVEYYLRIWLQIIPSLGLKGSKYFVAFKRQTDSLSEAITNSRFYFLDPWWSSNWYYRKSHEVANRTGAGVGYQLRIVTHYGPGSDSGKDVYLFWKAQTDFDDIRFVDDDHSTELDYWMQVKTDSVNATFWVEVQDDLSSSNATFYIYYGNGAVSTTSNGATTFQLFDHFDDSSLNLTLWDVSGGGNYTESGTWLNITGYDGQGGRFAQNIDSDETFNETVRMMYNWKFYQVASGIYDHAGLRNADVDFAMTSSYNTIKRCMNRVNSGSIDIQVVTLPNYVSFAVSDLQVNVSTNIRYDFTIMDYNQFNYSSTAYIPDSGMYVRFQADKDSEEQEIVIDWVFIAKYVSPEPLHGFWGSQESIARYVTFYHNTGGTLRVNNATVANTTLIFYLNDTALELVAIVEGNLTYGFANFTYDATSNISNPFGLTITSNLTVWTYFGELTGGVVGNPTGWTLALWGIAALILIPIGTVCFVVWKKK